MANDIIITPVSASIQFSGSANASIKLTVDASGSLSITGNSGSLFSITDNLSGSLMSVNTIAGLPILEVFSDNRVNIGKYAAEAIKIQSGGSDVALGSGSVMFVTSSGRVGIGTTVPGVKLDVFGTARILTNGVPSVGSGMEFSYVGGGSPYGTIYSYNRDTPAYIDTILGAGGNQLFLKASGNVGVGTSIPNTLLNVGSGTPSTAANGIQFGSDTSANLYRISTGVIKTDGGLTAAGNITIAKNGAYLYLNGTNGDAEILWQSNSSNKWAMGMNVGDATQNFNIYNYTTATTNLTVLSASGNVGIGITNPIFKLQVIGNIATYKNGSDSVASQLYIANAANTKAYNFQLNSAGTSLDLWGYDDGNGWKNNVTFAQGGNVGIGSTSPVNKLDVAGNVSITNLTASNINIGNFNSLSIGTSNQYHNIYLQKPLVAGANYHHLHLGTRWYWDFTANVWTASSQPNPDNPDWTAIDSIEYLSFKVGSVTGSVTSLTTSSYDRNERLRISLTDVRVVNSGSDAEFRIVENDSVNNPKLTFYNVTTPKWVVGVDAADSDKFKINKGALLNTTNVITINTSNNVGIGTSIPNTLLNVGSGTPSTAANGIQFGSDTSANLYRISTGVIKTDGGLTVAGTTNCNAIVGTTGTFSGNVSGSLFIEKYTTFTPTTVGWYRVFTTSVVGGGVLRIYASYNNKYDALELVWNSNGWGQSGQISIVKGGVYVGYIVSQVRVTGNSADGYGYLDIYVSDVTSAGPISIYAYGPDCPAFTAPIVVGAVTGSGTTKTLSVTRGVGTTDQFYSSATTGMPPLVVSSSTMVNNLNVQYLNGQLGSYYQDASNLNAGTISSARLSNVTASSLTIANSYRVANLTASNISASGTSSFGNVGIGTAIPLGKLHVYGLLRVGGAVGDQTGIIALGNDTNATASYGDNGMFRGGIGTLGSANYNNISSWQGIVFNVQNAGFGSQATRMIIDVNGNVGIGTTSPVTKLQVAGTSGTAIISVNNTSLNRSSSFGIDNTGAYLQNSTNGDYFDFRNATGTANIRVSHNTNTYLNTTYTSVGSLVSSGSKLSVFGNLSIGSTYASTAAPTNGAIFEGNVGIGTTLPVNKLDVAGNISCSVITASLFNGLNFIGGINTVSSSTTTTVDLRYAVTQMQLSQSITTFAHSNATSGSATWMLATVGAGTAVTITWPTSYKWPGGVAPSLTTTSAKRDVYQFMSYDGSSTSTGYVFATVVAQNM